MHSILPGYVATEGFPQTSLLENRFLRHIVAQPEQVARSIVGAIERGRPEVVVPWFPYRPASLLFGVAPGLASKLGARGLSRSSAFKEKR